MFSFSLESSNFKNECLVRFIKELLWNAKNSRDEQRKDEEKNWDENIGYLIFDVYDKQKQYKKKLKFKDVILDTYIYLGKFWIQLFRI